MKTIFSISVCVMLCFGVRAGIIDSSGYDTNAFVINKVAGTVTLNTNSANPKAAATKGDLAYALSLSNAVYQAQFVSNSIVKMSDGTGNEYTDMRASTNPSPSALGISFTLPNLGYDVWAASGSGLGSNVWGVPITFPGGVLYMGNPFWTDLPNARYQDQGFYWGMGPLASMRTNAWPNGQTNESVQPVLRIMNGNPFSGIAGIDIRTTFTNSIHGNFVGTNYDGVSMYRPIWGYTGPAVISDSYGNPDRTTGIIDQIGKYSQQAPSYQVGILSDPTLNWYLSMNATRAGDPPYGGQAPLMTIENDNFLNGDNEIIAGFPVQRGGVWDVRQATANAPTNWLWAFAVDERSSAPTVATTNSLLQIGTTIGQSTNKGAYIFGRSWDGTPALFNVQGTADFDLPTQVDGNYGAFTFDAVGTRRFGIVITQGEYPHIGHASGSPINISQYSATDLSTIDATHQPTFTNELTINPDSTVLIPFGVGSKSANSSLAVGTAGLTNTLTINYRLMGFTGTTVTQTNTVTHATFSRGTITTPTDIILQPNEAVRGSSCAVQGVQAF